nr:FtsX-like permease family protein [Gemmatimonadota bacterium]NIR76251.1 FtsX-like permease family protein [Candidatus Kutchimonas denitrificans]NIS02260.1 FtsX-like permease family protein [Gemmatimonadota bacterium]NIT68084.1 FtsX-like permease family protein [Gemmatimonadota bacterium]NIU54293.1 FtsX-like permease family protein [Gemmatimonadota bacterium]
MRDWKRYVRERLGLSEARGGSEESVVEELAAALEDLYGEARDRGLSPQEADAYARERVGDWDALAAELVKHRRVDPVRRLNGWLERGAQQARARGGIWSWTADMGRDLRYTWRTLRRSPGFATIALLTLALGIGAVTAVFSLANGVLLSPLPYAESDELVYMWEKLVSFENASVSYPNFVDWRERNRAFEDLAAFNDAGINLTGVGPPEELGMVRVSASMFPILKVQPALGRNFLPEEDRVGGERVVLLTHGFWQGRFGGDPEIIGSSLTLDGLPSTVIGVMPRDFVFPPSGDPVDIYTPIGQFAENWIESRGDHPGIAVIGRLRDDMTIEGAREDMERIALELEAEYPDTNTGARVHVWSLHDRMVRNLRQPVMLLLVAVGLLLLIACTNVANLVLARGTARQREIAIRSSLGAHGGRIVRLLLTENIMLWLAGGALGVILANFALPALAALRPDEISPIFDVAIDVRVVLVASIVALLTGLLFGLVPALRSLRPDLVEHLKEGSRSSGGLARNRARSALVIAEVGLAVALLIGAGLVVRSFLEMIRESPGIDVENLLAVEVPLSETRYSEGE